VKALVINVTYVTLPLCQRLEGLNAYLSLPIRIIADPKVLKSARKKAERRSRLKRGTVSATKGAGILATGLLSSFVGGNAARENLDRTEQQHLRTPWTRLRSVPLG
jgi:hypothetical protein